MTAPMQSSPPSVASVASHWRRRPVVLALATVLLAGCQSPTAELSGLAQQPPLDYAVLVSGGAFLRPAATGTFATPAASAAEPLQLTGVLEALRSGAVFQRVEVDDDAVHRRELLRQLRDDPADPELLQFLESARDRGFDLLLVVEHLQDGPIDAHGINGRWPVTLATWLLLGVGAFIPDHTFESGATLRATVRDLQTGRIVADLLTPAGPIDLSLVERSNALGIALSLVVPPFWVHDDDDNVGYGVRQVTERRLQLSLARELKSEQTRQRLREKAVAALALTDDRRLEVDAVESVSAVRLRPVGGDLDDAVVQRFEQALLATRRIDGARFHYAASLPAELGPGTVQVLVATITGSVHSATFAVGGPR